MTKKEILCNFALRLDIATEFVCYVFSYVFVIFWILLNQTQ